MCSVLYKRSVLLGDRGPIVTFTFDDFPHSALTTGGAIIERYGGKATFYVAMGLAGTTNSLGEQFNRADLHTLVDRGHEVGSHTFSHLSSYNAAFVDFKSDVECGEEAIEEELKMRVSRNFAYPYGEATLTAKKRLGPRMRSCRGTCPGVNGPLVDLNLLRANYLYGDRAEAAEQLIQENKRRGSWLIFYTHDVTENPSPYGCTPELLEAVVSCASFSGARILTVAEVIDELTLQTRSTSEAVRQFEPVR
jgi:peptidoglycan/xylan/chitin deacetylase (PgdA/CDA1 family)